jgi:hypothetical protein
MRLIPRRSPHIVFVFLMLLSLAGMSQKPKDLLQYKELYPDESALYLNYREQVSIALDEGDLDIQTDHHSELLFLRQEAQGLADKSISYSSFREILEIDAATLVPEKNNYRRIPVTEIEDAKRIEGGIFYDDSREKSFVFPGADEGAIAQLKYKEQIKEPRFLGAFYFNQFLPVLESEFVVETDADVQLKYILLGESTGHIEFSKVQQKDKTIYRWLAKDRESWVFEEGQPAINKYEPHVIIYIDEFEGKDGTEEVLGEVKDLYSWYRGLTENLNQEKSPRLAEITEELIAGVESDEEKVRRIFHWVQDNIRYIAFEDGLGGFIPREAALVCDRKYGDCKDMASICTEMLEIAGIKANLTWVGTRDIPYSYEEVPTPMVDNHMIASVDLGQGRIFLDATSEYLGFGYPSNFIQGKQALVGNGDDFSLETIPVVEVEKNRIIERVNIQLEESAIRGSGQAIYSGYPDFRMSRRLIGTHGDNMENVLASILELGNNKFQIDEYSIKDLHERDLPLQIDYTMILPDYAKTIAGEQYVNLHLDRRLQFGDVDLDRQRDLEFENRYEHIHEVSMDIPESWTVTYLPENSSWESDDFSFKVEYRQEENQVIMNRKIRINTLLLETEDFSAWNEMIEELAAAYSEVVVLAESP